MSGLFTYDIEMSGIKSPHIGGSIVVDVCRSLARIGCLVSMECMHSTRTRTTCIQSETTEAVR